MYVNLRLKVLKTCFEIYKLNYLFVCLGAMYLAWICYKAFVSKWTPPLGSRDPKSSPLNASHWIEFIASFAYPPLPQRDPKTHMNSRKSSALEYWPTSEVVTEKSIWSEPLYQIIWVIHFFIFNKCFFVVSVCTSLLMNLLLFL